MGGAPGAGAGGNRGLRGVLDGIVTDGMRVAAEVRRRMDEAQKELEKNATPGHKAAQDEEEEDDEDADIDVHSLRTPTGRSDAEGRSIRSVRTEDRMLLEGADAEAGGGNGKGESGAEGQARGGAEEGGAGPKARPQSVIEDANATRTLEFEG